MFFWVNCVHSFTLERLRVYRNVNKPVPPAIIPTCLNFRTFGSDFLSGRMENWPDQERISLSISMRRASWGCPDCLYIVPQWHLLVTAAVFRFFPHMHTHRTVSLIHQQSIGSSEVNAVSNSHVVQVLRHLPSLWEGGVAVLVVHLEELQKGHNNFSLPLALLWSQSTPEKSISFFKLLDAPSFTS